MIWRRDFESGDDVLKILGFWDFVVCHVKISLLERFAIKLLCGDSGSDRTASPVTALNSSRDLAGAYIQEPGRVDGESWAETIPQI